MSAATKLSSVDSNKTRWVRLVVIALPGMHTPWDWSHPLTNDHVGSEMESQTVRLKLNVISIFNIKQLGYPS